MWRLIIIGAVALFLCGLDFNVEERGERDLVPLIGLIFALSLAFIVSFFIV